MISSTNSSNLALKYVLPSFSDYFFSDSEDTGCIDCGICVVHAGNNDFGCWQYTTADNNFRCLPSEPEMSEFPEIASLNTRSRWSTYDVKNDVEKTCQIEAETKFNNLTCLQVDFYQIMRFTCYLNQKYVTNGFLVFFDFPHYLRFDSVSLSFKYVW